MANASLAALIGGAGYPSLDRFAEAVNARAYAMHGVKLSHDHVSVQRWVSEGVCQYPEAVAAVLSQAWDVPVPVEIIWPDLREGSGPVPAYLQVWVADRTLEDLGVLVRSDMLTRREVFNRAVGMVGGAALVAPVSRWLTATEPEITSDGCTSGIDERTVVGIERATRQFVAGDAESGGGLSREAAVGQLRYAVDLATDTGVRGPVGDRLLAAVAKLAGTVGWMSHDVGMNGPAQRYFLYGLQAAKESADPRAVLVAVGILADMARQMRSTGHPDTGRRLVEAALEMLPRDRRDVAPVRALLVNLRARMLAAMGTRYLLEIRHNVELAHDLVLGEAPEWEPWQRELFPYISVAQLASEAAEGYRDLAAADPRHAGDAERYALLALRDRTDGFTRSQVFDQIGLTRARFMQRQVDQASVDGEKAITMATAVPASRRVTDRLQELAVDSEPYRHQPAVKEFRERLHAAIAAA